MDPNAKLFGRYELNRMIGSGGMGEIYLATMRGPHGFEKKVVLKKIHQHLSRDEEFIRRFIDEGKLVVNLNHANIVQVFEMGIENGEYFLAMEYIDGVNLSDFLYGIRKVGVALPVELAVFILIEVLKGLSYAHAKTDESGQPMGIIHRDISPVNIMISRDGEVKLLDFGVAKAKSRMSQSLPGVLHGKFLYLSPEQARGEDIDFRSDIFSFGVTAYELITGIRPFDGQTDIEILDKIKNFNPPATVQPSFHGELAGIVMKCLEKDREKRYASTAELEEAFVNYLYKTHTIVGRKELQEFVRSHWHLFPPAQEGANGCLPVSETLAVRKPSFATKSISIGEYAARAKSSKFPAALIAAVLIIVAGLVYKFSGSLENYPFFMDRAASTLNNSALAGASLLRKSFNPGRIEFPPPENSKDARKETGNTQFPENGSGSTIVRANPDGSELFLNGKFFAKTPARLSFKEGDTGRCELKAKGYRSAFFPCGYDSPPSIFITLDKLKTGFVSFRFFPADSILTINDKEVEPQSGNLVEYELPEGEYMLKVASKDGTRARTRKFTVKEGEKSLLGTIDLTEKM